MFKLLFALIFMAGTNAAWAATLTIGSPQSGAKVTSPIVVKANVDSATCNSGLNRMEVLVNGAIKYAAGTCLVSTSVALPSGTSTILVRAIRWDSAVMAQKSIGVSTKVPAPVVDSGVWPSPTPSGTQIYVSPNGSDSNSGAASSPLRTILAASKKAGPGTTVVVAAGRYVGGFVTTASGTSAQRIRYLSLVKWGAKVSSGSGNTAWNNKGAYVDIEGFEVDGTNVPNWAFGLYSSGNMSAIKLNRVHHIGTNVTCTGQGGAGIEGDNWYDYNARVDVLNNVVHHIGTTTCAYIQGIYQIAKGTVANNLVYQVGSVGIHLWHDAAHINIVNNTVFSSGLGILIGAGDWVHGSAPADYINVVNNIVFDNKKGIDEQGSTGMNNTYKNNLVYNNGSMNWGLNNGLVHTGTVSADPQFVNYIRTGGGDYRLKSTSPAIDRGTTSYAPKVDLNNIGRPKGAGNDIGAYESY